MRVTVSWRLITAFWMLTAISIPVAWVVASYFRIDVPASMIFLGDDGHCDPATAGFGVHCFGDFNERWLMSQDKTPAWPNNLEMSPIGPFVTMAANAAASVVAPRVVLLCVIALYAACVLVPAIWAARGRDTTSKLIIISVLGVATYPFLVTMDRLNNVALLAPILLGFLVAICRNSLTLASLAIVAASAVKPQMILLCLGLVALHRFKRAVVTAVISACIVASLVIVAGGGDFGRVQEYADALTGYASESRFGILSATPPNVSLSRSLYVFASFLTPVTLWVSGGTLNVGNLVRDQALVVQGIGLTALWGITIWRAGRMSRFRLGVLSVVGATLLVGEYVASYYLIFALPVAALMLRPASLTPSLDRQESPLSIEGELDSPAPRGAQHRNIGLILAATSLSLTPLLIPSPTNELDGFALSGFPWVPQSDIVLVNLTPLVSASLWIVYAFASWKLASIPSLDPPHHDTEGEEQRV